jgi:hypothetical protein
VKKRVLGFFYFAITIAILIGVLKVSNWLPTVFQEGIIRKYGSIEEVKSKLRLRDIYIPSYFPQKFKWPPSRILDGGDRPHHHPDRRRDLYPGQQNSDCTNQREGELLVERKAINPGSGRLQG